MDQNRYERRTNDTSADRNKSAFVCGSTTEGGGTTEGGTTEGGTTEGGTTEGGTTEGGTTEGGGRRLGKFN